jgi:hypothetical protein
MLAYGMLPRLPSLSFPFLLSCHAFPFFCASGFRFCFPSFDQQEAHQGAELARLPSLAAALAFLFTFPVLFLMAKAF